MPLCVLSHLNTLNDWVLVSGWHDNGSGTQIVENGEVGVATLTFDLTTTSGAGGFNTQDGFYLDSDLTTPITSVGGLPPGFQILSFDAFTSVVDVFNQIPPGGSISFAVSGFSVPSIPHSFGSAPNNNLIFASFTVTATVTSNLGGGIVEYVDNPPGSMVGYIIATYDEGGGGSTVYPNTDTNLPVGWYRSDIPGIPENSDAALLVGATARPQAPRGIVIATPWTDDNPLWGFPGHAVVYKNKLIYAAGNYSLGTDLPTIHLWNGTSDYELCKVPGVAATPSNCVVTMAMGDGLIYLTTWDSGTTSADVIGRVLRLNPDSGQLTNVGDINSQAGHVPYSLMFHNGELWTATHRSDATSAGLIARIKPETQTTWTVDLDLTATGQKAVLSMASYKGNFYYGSMGTAGTFAVVGQRTPAAVYSVSLTATGGAASNFNGFYSMVTFGDNLYASYWNPDGTPVSKIYKFDGSAWTTVYNGAGATLVPYVGLYVDNGVLYAVGALKDGATYSGALLTTPDGTTWTDRTSTLVLTDGSTTLTEMMPSNAFGSIAY